MFRNSGIWFPSSKDVLVDKEMRVSCGMSLARASPVSDDFSYTPSFDMQHDGVSPHSVWREQDILLLRHWPRREHGEIGSCAGTVFYTS